MANIQYIRGKMCIINSYIAIPIKQVLTIESCYSTTTISGFGEHKSRRDERKINKASLMRLIWRFPEKSKCWLFNLP